jgi:DEAD/DEAH box helicase domain-containing protein
VEIAKTSNIPVPNEENIGYEVIGDDQEVIATIEIAWPDKKIGFMTTDQLEDKAMLEANGWKIINLLDAAKINTLFGGE